MFNKTIRSALSMLLVFCLLFAMSGNAIATSVSDSASQVVGVIDKEVDHIIGGLRDALADLKDEVREHEDTLRQGKDELAAEVKNALERVDADVDKVAAMVDEVEQAYRALYTAISDGEVTLAGVKNAVQYLQDKMDALWEAIDDLNIGVEGLKNIYKTLKDVDMAAKLAQLEEAVDRVLARNVALSQCVYYFVEGSKIAVAKALNLTEDSLRYTYKTLRPLAKPMAQKVYNWLYNNPDVVCGVVKEFGVFGLDLMVKFGPYAMDLLKEHSDLVILGMRLTAGGAYLTVTLGASVLGYVGDHLAFLADYKDEVVSAARKLYVQYGDEAKALVKVYVDYLNLEERYYNSTHADYTIFHDSLYLAIGDSTAVGPDSYVDKLAELLEIPHMTENLAQMDLTVEEAIALVKQNADLVGKADLITLGFSNINASTAMLNTLIQDYENEWTVEVGKDVAYVIDKTLTELKDRMAAYGVSNEKLKLIDEANEAIDMAMVALYEKLVEEGLDEATTSMVMYAAEAYFVSYITRMAWYPALVEAVYDINPDAQIVIVGTYNDLEGVVVDIADKKIDMGMIVRALTAVANLENLTQAFIGDECIYVHASAVETVFEEADYDNLNNLGVVDSILNDEMLPSDNGHAYIAEEIREALNVEYKIWGDVNGDRKVNCRDARLILKYAADLITENDLDLTWGDVNGDGKVNSRDARLILRLRAELIEHFPVCNLSEEE